MFEKDTEKFLEEAVHNQQLYISEAIREELQKCCYDHERLGFLGFENYASSFEGQVERLEQEDPEWFPDLSGDIPINGVKDPVLRASKCLLRCCFLYGCVSLCLIRDDIVSYTYWTKTR